MNYLCPVCGYNKMTRPPEDFYICPSCGTEFENDDFETTHAELKDRWVASGMRWFSRSTKPPIDWNPYTQLANLQQRTHKQISGVTKSSVVKDAKFESHWEIIEIIDNLGGGVSLARV